MWIVHVLCTRTSRTAFELNMESGSSLMFIYFNGLVCIRLKRTLAAMCFCVTQTLGIRQSNSSVASYRVLFSFRTMSRVRALPNVGFYLLINNRQLSQQMNLLQFKWRKEYIPPHTNTHTHKRVRKINFCSSREIRLIGFSASTHTSPTHCENIEAETVKSESEICCPHSAQ